MADHQVPGPGPFTLELSDAPPNLVLYREGEVQTVETMRKDGTGAQRGVLMFLLGDRNHTRELASAVVMFNPEDARAVGELLIQAADTSDLLAGGGG